MTGGATRRQLLVGAGVASLAPAVVRAAPVRPRQVPVYGHRGASALRPEHTLASYAKAIADGADFIEPDLVATKDGVLIARHENNIAETTNVARRPEFAVRRTTKVIDGEKQTGWFTEDFTLAELKTLRAIERLPKVRPANAAYDGRFDILTFEEVIDFVAADTATRGRMIGLVPELKHSSYFASVGLPLEDRFLATLAAHDYTRRAPIEVQSFETANLKALRPRLARMPNATLLQLVGAPAELPGDVRAVGGVRSYADMLTSAGLAEIRTYADVLGPPTRLVIPLDAAGRLGQPSGLVEAAHKAGLKVRPWTFRPENYFLPADLRDGSDPAKRNPRGAIAEIRAHLAAGIDGFFTDDPALGRAALTGQPD